MAEEHVLNKKEMIIEGNLGTSGRKNTVTKNMGKQNRLSPTAN